MTETEYVRSQSSIEITYKNKFGYKVKIYVDGENIKTPEDAEKEAQARMTSLITKNE